MSETIGKCECINSSDKFDLDRVLTEDIDELDDRLVRIRSAYKEIKEFGANPDVLTKTLDDKKSKLKNLLIKVRNTPGCKQQCQQGRISNMKLKELLEKAKDANK
jgi:hypothetical protein